MRTNNDILLTEIREVHHKHKKITKEASQEVANFRELGLNVFGSISKEVVKINEIFRDTQVLQVKFIDINRNWLSFGGYSIKGMISKIEETKDGAEHLEEILSDKNLKKLLNDLGKDNLPNGITDVPEQVKMLIDKNIEAINTVATNLVKGLGVFTRSFDINQSFISSGTYILESGIMKSLSNYDEILTMCTNILERTNDFEFRVRNNELVTELHLKNENDWIKTQLLAINKLVEIESYQKGNWVEAKKNLVSKLAENKKEVKKELDNYPQIIKSMFVQHEILDKNRLNIKSIYDATDTVIDYILENKLANQAIEKILRHYHTNKEKNYENFDASLKEIDKHLEELSANHKAIKDRVEKSTEETLKIVTDKVFTKLDIFSKVTTDVEKDFQKIIVKIEKTEV